MADRDDRASTAVEARDGSNDGETIVFDPDATVQYIAEMTAELAAMAHDRQLKFLAHLLEIAQLEAANIERRLEVDRRSR